MMLSPSVVARLTRRLAANSISAGPVSVKQGEPLLFELCSQLPSLMNDGHIIQDENFCGVGGRFFNALQVIHAKIDCNCCECFGARECCRLLQGICGYGGWGQRVVKGASRPSSSSSRRL